MIEFSKKAVTAKKAVILARVSSKEQEDGYSIEAQCHRLQVYCERYDLTVLKTFELVESSTQGDRREFMEMIGFVKKQRETIAIVADKIDRVQRSFKEYPLLDELIQQGKIELHFNTENYVIHKDSVSQERLMWSMGVIMAQSYIDNLRDNVKRSIEQKIRMGEWIAMAPIGYLNIQDSRGRGDVIVDQDRAPLVRKMFETYATGAFTLEELRLKTMQWGLKNRVGQKTYLEKSQVYKIITNPFYFGQMNIKGELYRHRYESLITKDLYDQCQAVAKGWKKKPFLWGGKEFIFRGLLSCAVGGRTVTADTKKKTNSKGEKKEWTYLRCANPEKPDKLLWVREEIILQQVEQVLKSLHVPKDMLDDLVSYIRQTDKVERDFLNRQLSELQHEYKTIQNRLDKLTDLLMDGAIERREYDRRKEQLRNDQMDIETHITAHREGDDGFKDSMVSLFTIMSNAYDEFKSSQISQKRLILNFVFANLSLKGNKLLFSIRKPFEKFANCDDLSTWRQLVDELRTDIKLRSTISLLITSANACELIKNTELPCSE